MYKLIEYQDQDSLKLLIGKRNKTWDGEKITINVNGMIQSNNISFHFLDPVLFTNAGGIFQYGKEEWKQEAHFRKIRKPVMIHLFHISTIKEKYQRIIDYNLNFTKNNKCLDIPPYGIEFPLWNFFFKI